MAASSRGTLSVTVPQAKDGKGEHPPCHGMHEEVRDEDHEQEEGERRRSLTKMTSGTHAALDENAISP